MSRLTIKSFQAPQPTASPTGETSPGAETLEAAPAVAPSGRPRHSAPPESTRGSAAPEIDPDLLPFAEYLQVFERTEGWFGLESAAIWDSLLAFQERQNWRGNLLEVGVYKGKSAALMAKRARGEEQLFCVDRFLQRDEIAGAIGALRPMPNPRVHLVDHDSHTLDTLDSLQGLERSFRFMHIDGEHSAAAIQNDLDLAHRFGSQRVLVAVDDIFQFVYPQLTESLFRYLREYPDRFTMVLVGFNKAYLTRPYHAHEYSKYIAEELGPRLERIGVQTTLSKSSYPTEMNAFGIGPRLECGPTRGLDHANDVILY